MVFDNSSEIDAFVGEFQAQNDKSLAGSLVARLQTLTQEHRDVCRDLERERVAGRYAQESAEQLEHRLQALEKSIEKSSYVLVLIDADADGYMFNDEFYKGDAAEGGERAALAIRGAVREYLQSLKSEYADMTIIVKAFASGDGLAYALGKAGVFAVNNSQYALSRFTSGFSQVEDLFDFILVRKGKDRADHKLIGAFQQAVQSPCCRKIILAACHDNGYVRMLEKFVHQPEVVAKVTLLKSFQTGVEFAPLPFSSVTMESVFRSQPISEGPPSACLRRSDGCANGAGVVLSRNETTPPASTAPSPMGPIPDLTVKPSRSYAATASSAKAPQPLPVYGTVDAKTILLNANDHRIDLPLPLYSKSARQSLNCKLGGGQRFCNRYLFHGDCPGGCGYPHKTLPEDEKLIQLPLLLDIAITDTRNAAVQFGALFSPLVDW
ncbi:hypothetical protein G7046_g8427 [Stylonectria norvegica]|nr:hypothetical protein G7046_g8427 [Stylonectria norvegica]